METVYATDRFNNHYEVKATRNEDHGKVMAKWYTFDNARRDGELVNAWVQHLEVRSTEDPKYTGAESRVLMIEESPQRKAMFTNTGK